MDMKLNDQNKLTSGLIILCCERRFFIPQSALDENEELFCIGCNQPMLFKGSNGEWYIPGKKVDF
ncbi:hypothetical protein [Paenibacillus borealis]|uniref:Uncharacterized protein n=1 Tax=Paenibacillus borealis TaxID=160799 RepID=A0A089LHW2_PAEBO|nr:hypothetical protein [Paenibacillus borealis]AIQ59700.1 hypothetical protein PBOR_24140 [Paenibacillus borealis]